MSSGGKPTSKLHILDQQAETEKEVSPVPPPRDSDIPLTRGVRKIVAIAVVLVTFGPLLYHTGYLFLAAWITRSKTMDPAIYERAVKYDPKNPEYHYLLAQIYNYSTQYLNMDRAREEYELAVRYNPDRSQYWQDLSKFYEQTGDTARSRAAMSKALEKDPNFALRHWSAANLYVRLGDQKAADQELRRAADLDPSYVIQVLDLVWAVYGDPDLVLASHIPNTKPANLVALNFFVGHDSIRGAELAWQRLRSFDVNREARFRYIDYLIEQNHAHEAWDVFTFGQKNPPAFFNGDFETELINGGFDWRISSTDDAEVRRDTTTVKEGLGSLQFTFSGKQNPNYGDVWHYLPVERNHAYELKFWMKTDTITSSEGVYVSVDGVNSEKQTGTSYWRQFTIPFTATSNLVRVTLRRDESKKLDNLLKGRLWLDGFNIAEVPQR